MNPYDRSDLNPHPLWNGRRIVLPAGGPTPPVRVGDIERDQAIADLGEHFAAGRLDTGELDERIGLAMSARFRADLDPLFADLPTLRPGAVAAAPRPAAPVAFRAMAPVLPMLLVLAVVGTITLNAPWLLWGFLWMFMFTGLAGRRFRPHHRQAIGVRR